jgi:hypothetical protein
MSKAFTEKSTKNTKRKSNAYTEAGMGGGLRP